MPPETQTQFPTIGEEKAMRMAEIERKRLDLRRRMEEASKARRAKKSFMTPDRKKKLRLLIRRKAAEELKKEQEQKAAVRKWTIDDRCGDPEDIDWASKEDLIDICEYYHQRILDIESEKWDLELEIRRKHFEIIDINKKVNDLRGKFQRPVLRKVSRYENQFAKLQRKAAEYNFRNQLRLVRRHDFSKDDDKKGHHDDNTSENKELNEDSELGSEQNGEGANEFEVESNAAESIITEGCETEDIVVAEENEIRLDTDESPLEGDSGLEPTEGQPPEIFVEESEFPLEANDGNLVYEGESRLDDQEFLEEDDVRLPETPPPAHTEEDLWLYLKDHVSSVHPSTVEEFVQNLIGTLQHVPEEYLMPVIEANIKRANTPSVTDGEHLTSSPDGVRPGEENEVFKEGILENGSCASPVDAEGEDFPPASEGSLFPDDAASLQAAD